MTHYRSSLTQHLKNQSRLIAREHSLGRSAALEQACCEYGFSTWKQALEHMARVDLLVDQVRASLPFNTKARAAEIGKQLGYPFLFDEQVGMRYDPTAPDQTQKLARRHLLLELFEQIHAPVDLNKSENAKLWFRPLLPLQKAHELLSNGRWGIKHLADVIQAADGADVITKQGYRNLTRIGVRDELVEYLHALYSQSVVLASGVGIDAITTHPGFKEFAGCSLRAILDGTYGKALTTVLDYARIGHWARSNQGSLSEHMVWHAGEATAERLATPTRFERHEGGLITRERPINHLWPEQYGQIAVQLDSVARLCPNTRAVQQILSSLRETLTVWMVEQSNDKKGALELFHKGSYGRQVLFLAPAYANQLKSFLTTLRKIVSDLFDPCSARASLLKTIGKLEKVVHAWLTRTRDHWLKKSVKLEMDSPGLVAIDPKDDPEPGFDTSWRRAELMSTPREENLLNAIRPHVFPDWKEEYENFGYIFDYADMDSEASLHEHLNGLVFYRYIGSAKTARQFWKEVNELVYFRPEHVWFKQKLIG